MKFQSASAGSNVEVLSHPDDCEWTHYMSVIDGTRDGAPTFFELPFYGIAFFIFILMNMITSIDMETNYSQVCLSSIVVVTVTVTGQV